MVLDRLRNFTPARVAIGRAGHSLPTRELLEFQLAHARAIDAVYQPLDARQLAFDLQSAGVECLIVHSAARDRMSGVKFTTVSRAAERCLAIIHGN